MANTGNTQQQINYGAAANDGQGDPLRTAFIKTDDNFDNVWLAGPVGSNITIGNNTIQSNNTNGNIILKPNGTGIVQANASIIPNADGVRDLGSSTQAWRRAYINELLPEDLTVSGDAVIGGNLTVQGDTIQIGNITTDTLTIQLANTAANAAAANGAGITVGANDNIATFRYTSGANRWNTNIGLNVTGGFSANSSGNVWSINNDVLSFPSGASWRSDRFTLDEYIQSAIDGYLNFQAYDNTNNVATELHMEHGIVQLNIYNGNNVTWEFDSTGNLTLPGNTFAVNYANGSAVSVGSTYGNANVANYLPTYGGNISAGNISAGNIDVADTVTIINDLYVTTGSFSGGATGTNAIYAGVPLFTVLGSDVVAQFSGNINSYTQFNFQNGNSGPLASGDYVITANNGDDNTFFFNMGLTSNNHSDPDFFGDTSTPNDAYVYVVGADATGPGNTGPGNLIIGSTNGVIKFFVGNTAQANVVQTISSSGVTVTGNTTAGNVLTGGMVSATGNITGNNVSTSTSFGLPVYANTSVRDSAIASPQPGMIIFVTGTGMQVRGATAWNTVAGTAT